MQGRLIALALVGALSAGPTLAGDGHDHGHDHGEKRELGAHEHGVGALNIAVEGGKVAIDLAVPGADIVGFEHPAKLAEDRAAVAEAMAKLNRPLELFVAPAAAGCTVASTEVVLVGDEAHQAAAGHSHDHGSKSHSHSHSHSHGHSHDHDHAEEGAAHSEFHAEYVLDCANVDQLTGMQLAYFAAFPNARELEVQIIGAGGATGVEVERDQPVLSLSGAI